MKAFIIVFVGALGFTGFSTTGYSHSAGEERAYWREFGFAGTYSGNTEFKPNTTGYIKIRRNMHDSHPLHFFEISECLKWCPSEPLGGGIWSVAKCNDDDGNEPFWKKKNEEK